MVLSSKEEREALLALVKEADEQLRREASEDPQSPNPYRTPGEENQRDILRRKAVAEGKRYFWDGNTKVYLSCADYCDD